MSRHNPPGSIGNRGKKGAAQPANAGTQSPKKTAGKKAQNKPIPPANSRTRRIKVSELSVADNGTPKAPLSRPMENAIMDSKMPMQVPDAVRELAEKTVEQAEKAFAAFMSAANKSVSMIPNPATDISKKTLTITEQNMKTAFDHARKLIHAKDFQEVMQLQAEFLKSQFAATGEQMKELTTQVSSALKDSSKVVR